MKRVFFDTWAWLAIAHKDDAHHKPVFAYYRDFLLSGGIPVSTDYIFAETITLLRARTAPTGAAEFIDAVLNASRAGRVQFEGISSERWQSAWRLCKKYSDKPSVSFIDFTSFIVMKELRITDVVTADRHFEQIGMGFRKIF